MTAKCACCGCAVPDDAERAGYVRKIENVIVDVVVYRICGPCVQRSRSEPQAVAHAFRRHYERTALN